MIRINLLAADRATAKKKPAVSFGTSSQKMIAGCSLLIILSLSFIGWRIWALAQQSTQIDAEIAAGQQETTRLSSVIQQVQQFEQRKAQLQQRVVLIEQLRKDQTGPVHMLDQISRALPSMLWLTALKQTGDSVLIDGRSTTITALSDYVANLEATGYFKRSIEIVATTSEVTITPPGEIVRFSIRAEFQQPGASKPASTAKRGG
jgi:type IV pilus assembly protein PilN